MHSSLELRFATALKEAIQEEMGEYISELDSIDLTKPNAIILVAMARERYSTNEDKLAMIDDILEKLGE